MGRRLFITIRQMRKIKLENDVIAASLKVKDTLTEEIKGLQAQSEGIEKRFNEILAELSREDEKVKAEIKHEKESMEFAEYEELSRVYLDENKVDVYIEVADRLEEFKAAYADAKNNGGNPVQGDGGANTDAEQPTGTENDSSKGQE